MADTEDGQETTDADQAEDESGPERGSINDPLTSSDVEASKQSWSGGSG